MIELIPTEHDDADFLSLVQRIVNGALAELRMRELFLVHVDNWFDHKWLGWNTRWRHGQPENLRVPLFNPNRVCSEKHFVQDWPSSEWSSIGLSTPLHIRQPGRPSLAMPLARFSRSAAFVWYSGSTTTNKAGSLMLYLSGAEDYAWYASFRKGSLWTVADGFHITRGELTQFERRGLQMELARVHQRQ